MRFLVESGRSWRGKGQIGVSEEFSSRNNSLSAIVALVGFRIECMYFRNSLELNLAKLPSLVSNAPIGSPLETVRRIEIPA
jgi:hypothetical protein